MINKEFIKSTLLGSLVLTVLAFGSFKASAFGFQQQVEHNGKAMSANEFNRVLEKTSPNRLASNFGKPDEIVTMKNAAGNVAGVMWVYHRAVLQENGLLDARFLLVNGQMKYVTLTETI